MSRLHVALDDRLLVRVLRNPEVPRTISPAQYTRVINAATKARLLGWLVRQSGPDSLPRDAPSWLRDRLVSAAAMVAEYNRALRWEMDRLDRAFFGAGVHWVLLKGAAYLAAGLPQGSGRHVADIDILVPERQLARSEEILKRNGWGFPQIDPYDDRYYRQWMHESPPMVHTERGSVVDVRAGDSAENQPPAPVT